VDGTVGVAVLASTEHCQRVIQRRNIKDAIEVSARKHFVDEGTWVHQLHVNAIAFGPAMQRDQQSQTACVERFDIREIEHDNSVTLLRKHCVPQRGFLAAHNSACALYYRDVSSTFVLYGKHDLLLSKLRI
jgi:hypothetical protein